MHVVITKIKLLVVHDRQNRSSRIIVQEKYLRNRVQERAAVRNIRFSIGQNSNEQVGLRSKEIRGKQLNLGIMP
jgi:hypothetical protein